MNCLCDVRIYPLGLDIPPGHSVIPRQIAGFPELRAAMIADIADTAAHPGLAGWRPGKQTDLGMMLIEMWAYIGDALAFQDEVHAHECYLRTARLRSSTRRLVDLLGYLPRPAVAATVKLAILGEGRRVITLPRGTSFRSGAFGAEAPQVFELDSDTRVHPLLNRWTVEPPRPVLAGDPGGPGANPTRLLLDPKTARLVPGDLVRISSSSAQIDDQVATVMAVSAIAASDGTTYIAVDFTAALTLPASTRLLDLQIQKPTQSASPWTLVAGSAVALTGANVGVSLDGIHRQLKAGQRVIVKASNSLHVYEIAQVNETAKEVITGLIGLVETKAKVPVTQIWFDIGDSSLAWEVAVFFVDEIATLVFHHGLVDAGRVGSPASTALSPPPSDSALVLAGKVEVPFDPIAPRLFQLRDKDGRSLEIGGSVDLALKQLQTSVGTTWVPALALPVDVFGNIVNATRGESVAGEILGSGDASLAHQSFKLKKSPLTYITAPGGGSASGVVAALAVYVGGVRYREAPSFYGALPSARIYIVRQNDVGESTLTFGDGTRGARLATGALVTADYRFGAGKATPPAGSIQQLGKTIKGITGVVNPIAAGGGDDAETAATMQVHAPRQALLLGRAVSLLDMAAVAAGVAGVIAVSADWAWSDLRMRPVVQIAFIGSTPPDKVALQIRSMSDPSTEILAGAATPVPVGLALSVDVDTDNYRAEEVAAAVAQTLLAEGTGLLSLERVGIGAAFYRSRLSEAVLTVPGAIGLSVLWNRVPMKDSALSPGTGKYFDVQGAIFVNGKEYHRGE